MKSNINTETKFDDLVARVIQCDVCKRMCGSKRVLNRGCGPLSATILVIGEAPGRLGADASELPFHGDKAGHNFEALIELAGLSRKDLFITNAALCNPKDDSGNNSTPTDAEIKACSGFLREQIDLVNPKIVVTLGAVALKAVSYIEPHALTLKNGIRTSQRWYNRELVPLYHPGQRAMIHRSFANQTADYQFLSERVKKNGSSSPKPSGRARSDAVHLASAILSKFGKLSYFSFHKYSYLAEYLYSLKAGRRLTGAYFVRQKDGPYCVDLHPQRLKNAGAGIEIVGSGNRLYVVPAPVQMFSLSPGGIDFVDADMTDVIDEVFRRYAKLSNSRLKTVVYMTKPMRDILRREKMGSNQFNAPIDFVSH
jgi:uracil-DNA glycosylase family 4